MEGWYSNDCTSTAELFDGHLFVFGENSRIFFFCPFSLVGWTCGTSGVFWAAQGHAG